MNPRHLIRLRGRAGRREVYLSIFGWHIGIQATRLGRAS